MRSERLVDHEDYRITLHQISTEPTDKLLITYGGQPSDLSDNGFGTDFAERNGWDNIFVAQRHGTQFQGLSLDEFSTAVSATCEGRDVISYGSSLGGYAALYFGGCINARIIAAAPMLPAWRPLNNKAYLDVPVKHIDLSEAPLSRRIPTVIYDPMLSGDTFLVENMTQPAYPKFRSVELPHAGHTVLITLSQARLLKPLVMGLIEQDEVCDLSTMPEEGSAIWHGERGKYLLKTDKIAARRELETSIAIAPSRNIVAVLLNLLIGQNELQDAQRLIDNAEASKERRFSIIPSARDRALKAGLRVADNRA